MTTLLAILTVLRHGPATTTEIADELHVARHEVFNVLRHERTRGKLRKVRVAGWQRTGAGPAIVWGAGHSADAPRPPAQTGAERTKAHHDRKVAPKRIAQRVAISVFDLGRKMADDA